MKTYADPEAQAEIDRLRAELDRLRKVLLAEWEKDRKTYAALMIAVNGGEPNLCRHGRTRCACLPNYGEAL